MHPIFHVQAEHIQRLNDEQARELVARLCNAEVSKRGGSTAAVTWGGDQRAKDGGVDVRVDLDPPIALSGYVKRDKCAFQVKAEKFGPKKIPNEMAPDSVLRPAIFEYAETGDGTYVIVSSRDNCSDSALNERRKAMEDCLAANGRAGATGVD
jgi:hypothetical protein